MSKWPLHKNTQNNPKTGRTPRRNRHLETTIFVFFGLTIEKAHTRINLFFMSEYVTCWKCVIHIGSRLRHFECQTF